MAQGDGGQGGSLPGLGGLPGLGLLGAGGGLFHDNPKTYEELKRRRAIAQALASRGTQVKDLASGMTAFGEGLGTLIGDMRLRQMEREQQGYQTERLKGAPTDPPTYNTRPPASTPPPQRTSSAAPDGGVNFDVADLAGVDEAFAPPAPEVAATSSRSLAEQTPPEPNLPAASAVVRSPQPMAIQQASLSGGITPNTPQGAPTQMERSAPMPGASSYVAPVKLPEQAEADIRAYVPEHMQQYARLMVGKESSGRPNLVSPTGAKGYTQFTRGTGRDYGMNGPGFDNRADPRTNLEGFVKLTEANDAKLKNLLGRDPYLSDLAAAHQQGFGGYSRLNAGQLPPGNNLAVNNIRTRDPAAAMAKVKGYYGAPDEPLSPRESVTRALAARQGTGNVLDEPRPVQTVDYKGPVATADNTPSMAQQPPEQVAEAETPNEVPPQDPQAIVPRRVQSAAIPPSMMPPKPSYAEPPSQQVAEGAETPPVRTAQGVQPEGVSAPPADPQESRGRIAAVLAGLPSRPGAGAPTAALGQSPLGVPNPQQTVSPIDIPPEGAPSQQPPAPTVAPDTAPAFAQAGSAAGPNGVTDAPGVPPGWGTNIPQNPATAFQKAPAGPLPPPPDLGPRPQAPTSGPSTEPIPNPQEVEYPHPGAMPPRPLNEGVTDYEKKWDSIYRDRRLDDATREDAKARVDAAQHARETENANQQKIWMDKVNDWQQRMLGREAWERERGIKGVQLQTARTELQQKQYEANVMNPINERIKQAEQALQEAKVRQIPVDAAKAQADLDKAHIDYAIAQRQLKKPDSTTINDAVYDRNYDPSTGQLGPMTLAPGSPQPKEESLTAEQNKAIYLATSTKPEISYIRSQNNGEILANYYEAGKFALGGRKAASEEYLRANDAYGNAMAAVLSFRSGQNVTPSEAERQEPTLRVYAGDTPQLRKDKMERIDRMVDAVVSGGGRKAQGIIDKMLRENEAQVVAEQRTKPPVVITATTAEGVEKEIAEKHLQAGQRLIFPNKTTGAVPGKYEPKQ